MFLQLGIVIDVWQYTYPYQILKCFNIKDSSWSLVSFSEKFSLWKTFVHSLGSCDQYWRKQNVKTIDFQSICFPIDDDILDHLFTRLWTFYTDFVLMQVNTASDTPMLTIFYPVCTKEDWCQQFAINTGKHLLKLFNIRHLMVREYLEMIF